MSGGCRTHDRCPMAPRGCGRRSRRPQGVGSSGVKCIPRVPSFGPSGYDDRIRSGESAAPIGSRGRATGSTDNGSTVCTVCWAVSERASITSRAAGNPTTAARFNVLTRFVNSSSVTGSVPLFHSRVCLPRRCQRLAGPAPIRSRPAHRTRCLWGGLAALATQLRFNCRLRDSKKGQSRRGSRNIALPLPGEVKLTVLVRE